MDINLKMYAPVYLRSTVGSYIESELHIAQWALEATSLVNLSYLKFNF